MARRAGCADLPLHGGHVPGWLADRMTRLGAVISEAIVHHYGRDELLRRLANPFWFQSFGAVMGMDWHSSGITTSVIGALKPVPSSEGWRRSATSWAFTSVEDVATIRGERRRNSFPSVTKSVSMEQLLPRQATWLRRSTARQCRMASIFTCTALLSPTMESGPSCNKA
jgi:Protein of unknown function (DUF763)